MLKVLIRPHSWTHLSQRVLTGRVMVLAAPDRTTVTTWLHYALLKYLREVTNIWETKQPLYENIGHGTCSRLDRLLICTSRTFSQGQSDFFFPPTILCWLLSLIPNNTPSHPGGNSPLPPGISDSNISPDGPPPFNVFYGPYPEQLFLKQTPKLLLLKLKIQIYKLLKFIPRQHSSLLETMNSTTKIKMWAIVMIDPLTISLLTPSCGDIVVLHPQIWIFLHVFYSTRYHTKYMYSGRYMFYSDLTALFQIISVKSNQIFFKWRSSKSFFSFFPDEDGYIY